MGAAAPVLAKAAVPIMIGSTALSGAMQYRQGKAAARSVENESKRAANQEEAQLREEKIERRERLIQALSAQNASVGASGARMSGSALNIAEESQRQFEQEDFRRGLSGKSKVESIRQSGRNRARAHRVGAKISLVDTASKTANIAQEL